MVITYGIDVIPFERSWRGGTWKAVMGVCVGVENSKKFEESYKEAIKRILSENKIETKRFVHSSFSINKLTRNPDLSLKIFESMFANLLCDIQKVHFIISFYPKTPEIFIFGRKRMDAMPPAKFIERHLIGSYPHVCAWKILGLGNTSVLTDAFTGYITEAWEDIDNNDNMKILFNGDECSPLISISDMILRIADKRLRDNYLFLGRRELIQIFPELKGKLEVDFLGKSVLPKVTPLTDIEIPIYKKIKHPVIFVIGPQTDYLDSKFIRYSPVGESLLCFANVKNGCLKMFNKNTDQDIIQNGDYFVYLDDQGKKAAQLIEKLGFSIRYFGIDEIDDEIGRIH